MKISQKKSGQDGNSTIVAVVMVMVLLVLFIGILDVCRLLAGREHCRNAADAIALAAAQEMIFLEYHELETVAVQMANRYGCRLDSIDVTYDMVTIAVASEVELLVLDRLLQGEQGTIRSVSAAGVTYPWDGKLGLCSYHEFSFRDSGN
jgi:uncharacterized membrane protein